MPANCLLPLICKAHLQTDKARGEVLTTSYHLSGLLSMVRRLPEPDSVSSLPVSGSHKISIKNNNGILWFVYRNLFIGT